MRNAAWNADNLQAFLAGRATIYKGHEGARRGWEEYRGEGAFGKLTAEIEQVRDLGETVLVLGRFSVIGRATQIEFDAELGQVLTFREGKIASSHDYLSHRDALEAAGLSG